MKATVASLAKSIATLRQRLKVEREKAGGSETEKRVSELLQKQKDALAAKIAARKGAPK